MSTIPQAPLAVSFTRAAELTSLAEITLRRLAQSGELKTVRVGRRTIVPMASLVSLVQTGSLQRL
jgi:hypothetical protein